MSDKLTEAQIQTAILNRVTTKHKETPLENALTHFVSLSKLLLEQNGVENFDEKCDDLLLSYENEMDNYKLQIEKEILLAKAEEIDIANNEKMTKQYEVEIENVKEEITQLKQELADEKIKKENKEKYLALVKIIATHPKRSETEQAIADMERELKTTEQESARISSEFELRSKQFAVVQHGLYLLKQEYSQG